MTAAASDPAWPALWISVGALAVSIITVLVTVVLWHRDGWRVSVSVGQWNSGREPTTIAAHITNVGRMSCVIQNISIRTGALKRPRGLYLKTLTVALNTGKLPKTLAPTETVVAMLGGPDVLVKGWFRVVVTSGNRLYPSAWTNPMEVGIPTRNTIPARRPGIVRWRR